MHLHSSWFYPLVFDPGMRGVALYFARERVMTFLRIVITP